MLLNVFIIVSVYLTVYLIGSGICMKYVTDWMRKMNEKHFGYYGLMFDNRQTDEQRLRVDLCNSELNDLRVFGMKIQSRVYQWMAMLFWPVIVPIGVTRIVNVVKKWAKA